MSVDALMLALLLLCVIGLILNSIMFGFVMALRPEEAKKEEKKDETYV